MSYAVSERPPAPTRGKVQTLEAVRVASSGGGFDVDAWHVMDQRDNALIADEVLNGAGSSKFVYSFPVAGSGDVAGISVIGARHLASHYGGLKHRMVASVQKIGALHTFTSYPQPDMPMSVQTSIIHDLADEEDYYEAIVEITDVKSGNSIQVAKRENRYETKRDGSRFERLHYPTIAQSKCYRNGILAVIPQDIQMRWKLQMLSLNKQDIITVDVMSEKRGAVLRFAASKGLALDRPAVEALTMDQIGGLSDAARAGQQSFEAAARALSVLAGGGGELQPARLPEPLAPPKSSPQAGKKSPAESRAPVESTRPPASREAPRSADWLGYLVNQDGEMVGADFKDPAEFAKVFVGLWRKSDDAPGLLAANADTVAEARQLSPAAAEILRALDAAASPESTHQPGMLEVAIPSNGRGAAWVPYLKALRQSLSSIGADRLAAWSADNAPAIRTAPDSYRLQAVKLIQEHAAAVGAPVPDAVRSLVAKPAPAQEQPDKEPDKALAPGPEDAGAEDEKWVATALEAVDAETTRDAVLSLVNAEAFARRMADLHQDQPALYKQVDEAISRRLATIDAAAAGDMFPGDRP